MSIEFDKIALEGDAQQALETLKSNKVFTDYIIEAVRNREDAVRVSEQSKTNEYKAKVDEFRQTNIGLKEQLEKFNGFDPDEYKRLKLLGSTAEAASERIKSLELDFQAQLKGRDSKIEEYEKSFEVLKQARADDAFRFDAHTAISAVNMNNKQSPIHDGATPLVVEKAMAARRVTADGRIIMMDGDKEFTTDKGIGSLEDWINTVCRRNYPFLFKQPSGGGAVGSGYSGGAGNKTITRAEFDSLPADKKADVARNYKIV